MDQYTLSHAVVVSTIASCVEVLRQVAGIRMGAPKSDVASLHIIPCTCRKAEGGERDHGQSRDSSKSLERPAV